MENKQVKPTISNFYPGILFWVLIFFPTYGLTDSRQGPFHWTQLIIGDNANKKKGTL